MAPLSLNSMALLLLLAAGAAAQTAKTAPKQPPAAEKKAVTARPPAAAAKQATAKKTTVRKTTARKQAVRPRAQQKPAPERYAEIQQALIGRGFLNSPADGKWNDSSAVALKKFQESQKLAATGRIDALSLIRLGLGPKTNAGLPPSEPEPKP